MANPYNTYQSLEETRGRRLRNDSIANDNALHIDRQKALRIDNDTRGIQNEQAQRGLSEYDKKLKTTNLAMESYEVLRSDPKQRAKLVQGLIQNSENAEYWKTAWSKNPKEAKNALEMNVQRWQMMGGELPGQDKTGASPSALRQEAARASELTDLPTRTKGEEAELALLMNKMTPTAKERLDFAAQEQRQEDAIEKERYGKALEDPNSPESMDVAKFKAATEKEKQSILKADAAKEATRRYGLRTAKIVSEDIDTAIDSVVDNPFWTTGFVGGQALSKLGGTEAADLRATLVTIAANISLDKMRAMREGSPTGSTGLGQVSEMEHQMMMSSLGAIEQSQSAKGLTRNLKRLKWIYNDIIHGLQPGEGTPVQSPPGAVQIQPPAQNAKGWTIMTDANGTQAYVSPDGTQFEEVE